MDCRVATVGAHTSDTTQGLFSDIASFERMWEDIITGSGITCSSSGATLPPASPPSLLLLDVSSFRILAKYAFLLHVTYMMNSAGVPVYMAGRRSFFTVSSPCISMVRSVHCGIYPHIWTRITGRHRRYHTFVRRRQPGYR